MTTQLGCMRQVIRPTGKPFGIPGDSYRCCQFHQFTHNQIIRHVMVDVDKKKEHRRRVMHIC